MNPFTEDDLIAYHLGELSWLRRRQLKQALENDPALAAESEAIAETLRAFSADSAAGVDAKAIEGAMDRSWQRLRPSLEVLSPAPHRTRTIWFVGAGGALAGALAMVIIFLALVHRVPQQQEATNGAQPATLAARAQNLLVELRGKGKPAQTNNNQPGMLVFPDAVAEDPSLAAHLDTAERVLTEVSHSDGRLQPETREQVHHLLLENAVYYNSAESRGDMSTASVIDDLGRVLTSLDAEPQEKAHSEDSVQLQLTVGNVLFDLRILHNTAAPAAPAKPAMLPANPAEKIF